ncbi:MAG TPA: DUF1326 domain-containing protein [Candidatus Hydrogenedentes bacterium]|nr:DUF1326 domain-containing protein [Candidatus Hydrogenedentota bacterium]HRK33157.1 DUF1326 domain-containing protein [Candidatus Hydrogenedentota bacterium]
MYRTIAKLALVAAVVLVVTVAVSPASASKNISGRYVETRSCDVFTGPCFANGEVGVTGGEAILTWAVDSGEWNGVALDGLNVIAVVAASHTLGDPYRTALPAKSIMIVDQDASEAQRAALVDMAKNLGGELVREVVDVKSAAITANIGNCTETGCAKVEAEGLVEIATRCLHDSDHKCAGNETTYYEPLTEVTSPMAAFTTVSRYSGDGLGITWTNVDRRSAFLGAFVR